MGCLLGLAGLEILINLNPHLLVRGVAPPSPIEIPLTTQNYQVRYADADEIYWRPDLFPPIPPEANHIEAEVSLQTDEFGFRNYPPLPQTVDVVVLGRSTSLGAQVASPWPERLAQAADWRVLNLAQPGGSVRVRQDYVQRFGLPRQPKIIILEVSPRLDIAETGEARWLLEAATPGVLQVLIRRFTGERYVRSAAAPIYPLTVQLPAQTVALTCCVHYMDFFSLNRPTLEQSRAWADYQAEVLALVALAQQHEACVALLFAPSKEDTYLSLATQPTDFAPVLTHVKPLQLDADGHLVGDATQTLTPATVQANALVGYTTVADFAQAHNLIWLDPLPAMQDSILQGQSPFMVYDSHWNALGHQIIADTVAADLPTASCP